MFVFCVPTPGDVWDQILRNRKSTIFSIMRSKWTFFDWILQNPSWICQNLWKSPKSLCLWDHVAPRCRQVWGCSDMLSLSTPRAASISGDYTSREPRHAARNRERKYIWNRFWPIWRCAPAYKCSYKRIYDFSKSQIWMLGRHVLTSPEKMKALIDNR